jgi:hypothetical protein
MEKLGLSRLKFSEDVNAKPKLPGVVTEPSRAIAFSSPMPWLLAIVLSLGIWAVLGWSVWRFVDG